MTLHNAFHIYNTLAGVAATVGLLYVLRLHRIEGKYHRFVFVTTAGVLVFAVLAPLVEVLEPQLVHLVHATAALLIIFGLYDPVRNDLRKDQWAGLLLQDPAVMRKPSDWMTPMDDRILELFHTTDLVLTPAIIAYNIQFSREEVNRRLSELEAHGLVERVERGKYRITGYGEDYLHGRLHISLLESDGTAHD